MKLIKGTQVLLTILPANWLEKSWTSDKNYSAIYTKIEALNLLCFSYEETLLLVHSKGQSYKTPTLFKLNRRS